MRGQNFEGPGIGGDYPHWAEISCGVVVVVVVSGGRPKILIILSDYGLSIIVGFSPHPVSILMLLLPVKQTPYGRLLAESMKLHW